MSMSSSMMTTVAQGHVLDALQEVPEHSSQVALQHFILQLRVYSVTHTSVY